MKQRRSFLWVDEPGCYARTLVLVRENPGRPPTARSCGPAPLAQGKRKNLIWAFGPAFPEKVAGQWGSPQRYAYVVGIATLSQDMVYVCESFVMAEYALAIRLVLCFECVVRFSMIQYSAIVNDSYTTRIWVFVSFGDRCSVHALGASKQHHISARFPTLWSIPMLRALCSGFSVAHSPKVTDTQQVR